MSGKRTRFEFPDCDHHGANSGAELFIVEGESAARSVQNACDPTFQAVIPMQGKPINAIKAKRRTVERYALFSKILHSLGYENGQVILPERCRYERVILLFDPDADGIHCGALTLMYFFRMLRPLLAAGFVCLVRAPLHEIRGSGADHDWVRYAFSDEHLQAILRELPEPSSVQRVRYRGLAGMDQTTLRQTCLHPATRTLNRLQIEDAEAAIAMFGGR